MRRHSALLLFSIICGLLLALSGPVFQPASVALAAKEDYGFSGPRHQGVALPTSDKPQSKLWFNDGRWWANMWDAVSGSNHIFRLDGPSQTWVDTGVQVDTRANRVRSLTTARATRSLPLRLSSPVQSSPNDSRLSAPG